MDENGEIHAEAAQAISNAANAKDAPIDTNSSQAEPAKTETVPVDLRSNPFMNGEIRTLDGDIAGDEFAADAIN
jgi:ankyrin repeat and BTB/POZ domain-containing protein 1